ncbi:helix-turn-helix domain-containing protein [Leisingera sp. ANG-DT]|uniref:helix-turn-helix domain-containing protein n=1 Tax=Leisingera sp. ANG-DT TaxID=1577897 RepID=UPI00068CDBA2|nr:helix-turn-helix transcriptional regulator [Leisingera sp. ANG-DT]
MQKSIYDETYRQLVAALKAARLDAGMTQQQVAEALSKPQSYVAKVEGFERRLDVIEFIVLARCIAWDPFPLLQQIYGYGSANGE